MKLFDKLVRKPLKKGLDEGETGIPIPLTGFNRYTNNTQRGQFIAIGGKSNSGKTSYMDFVYMITVYKWWKETPENMRIPLKFIYFNMKHSEKNKFQKWVLLYLKLEYNLVMDINTLNNGVGKLYELDEDTLQQIASAESFFEEMETDGVLTLVNGSQTPTSIYNIVVNEMNNHGTLDKKSGKYSLEEKKARQFTMVFIDTAYHLLSETEGFGMLSADQLNKKLVDFIFEFKNTYNITTCVIVPPKYIGRTVKENEPNYKELGLYGMKADLGFVMYNPYNEGNANYINYNAKDFMIRGKNRFRTITIVRNLNGMENVTKALIFLGECGYFSEAPGSEQEESIVNLQSALASLP